MIIQKRRINNIETYMKRFGTIKQFYICVKNCTQNKNLLIQKNVCVKTIQGHKFVPGPVGPITSYNANGKTLVKKNLEKEPRTIEHDYHVIDWHGQDHYGTCYQTRMCFPIEVLLPPCEEITIEERIIRSEVLKQDELNRVKHIINMFLEIFGMCEIVDENLQPICSGIVKNVPWTILPPGKYPWDKAKEHLKNYFNNVSDGKKMTIEKRHKILADYEPDFLAIGEENFRGYVVYGYTQKDMYYFESNEPGNATYVFKGKWENASKLTKRDIISGNLCYRRLTHTEKWGNSISQLMNG